jgi:hypothetical protein
MTNKIDIPLGSIGIIVLILLFVLSAGCIKQVEQTLNISDNASPLARLPLPGSTNTGSAVPAEVQASGTPAGPSTVTSADPIYPEDWFQTYRNLSGKEGRNIPLPVENDWSSRIPIYTLDFSPIYCATAIEVNVTQGPLVIIFKATPNFDNPQISFADVTVRALPSKEIVANERIDHYLQPLDTANTTMGGPTEYGAPDEKQIVVYKDGLYHITVDGNQIAVDISVYTGDSPVGASGSTSEAPSSQNTLSYW